MEKWSEIVENCIRTDLNKAIDLTLYIDRFFERDQFLGSFANNLNIFKSYEEFYRHIINDYPEISKIDYFNPNIRYISIYKLYNKFVYSYIINNDFEEKLCKDFPRCKKVVKILRNFDDIVYNAFNYHDKYICWDEIINDEYYSLYKFLKNVSDEFEENLFNNDIELYNNIE